MLNISSYIELNSVSVIEKRIKVNPNKSKVDNAPVSVEFKTEITSNIDKIIEKGINQSFYVVVEISFDGFHGNSLNVNGILKQQYIFNIIDFDNLKNIKEMDIIKYTMLITYLETRNQLCELWRSIGLNASVKLPFSSNKMFNFDNVEKLEK